MDQGWFSFTSDQKDILPPGFDPNKKNVVIFNSSEWELLGLLDDYKLDLYASQSDALLQIAQDMQACQDVDVYLRVHPHLRGKLNPQTQFIAELLTGRFRNFHVISAESEISTYLLLAKSDVVITFGSTVGIEAAYHRKPSLLLGSSRYEDLQACYRPASHQEVLDYVLNDKFRLSQEELEKRRRRALKFAFMYQAGGIPYESFVQTGVYDIKFKAKDGTLVELTDHEPTFDRGIRRELESRVELTTEHNPLSGTVKDLLAKIDQLQAQVDELEAQCKSSQKLLSEMSNSRAWKIARELQVLKSKLLQQA
jgi:outer membrane murein-binding lipoprotein Lpp